MSYKYLRLLLSILFLLLYTSTFGFNVGNKSDSLKNKIFNPSIGFRLSGGTNFFRQKNKLAITPKLHSIPSFKGGVFIKNHIFGDDFSIRLGFSFSQKGNRYDSYNLFGDSGIVVNGGTNHYYFIEVPIELMLEIANGLRIEGGLGYSKILKGMTKEKYYILDDLFKKSYYSTNVGLSYSIKKWEFSFSYARAITCYRQIQIELNSTFIDEVFFSLGYTLF